MPDFLKDWLSDLYEQAQQWFYDFILWVPRKLWAEFLEQVADFLDSLGSPEFFKTATELLELWGPDAAYWFDLLRFNWGMSLVISAITFRYVWTKIPFVGGR